ncbi:MAG: acyl carrier protein [Thermoanaerobaculia bacterium]
MNATQTEIRDTIFSVLAEIAPEADPAAVNPAESLREQLDLDSMDFLSFVIALHKRLGVEIPEADYPKLASIDGAASYLAARIGAPHA